MTKCQLKAKMQFIFPDEFASKPFLGVPFTTKDSTFVGGKLHTLGLLSRKTTVAKEDAECVRMAKKAGAIILATTNIPEVNKWQETRNNLFGQTNNPYDVRRTVGGSSGGEAALISSCASVFGLGSDIGGSVRMPGKKKDVQSKQLPFASVIEEWCLSYGNSTVMKLIDSIILMI